MRDKAKTIGMIIGVILFIILISSITYAAYSWISDPEQGYIKATSECFIIDYTKGTDILNGSLDFSSDYTGGLSVTVKAKINDNCDYDYGVGTLYLDTKDDTSDYLINNGLIRYQVEENGILSPARGTITTKGKIPIYDGIYISKTESEFTVYIWLSIEDVTDSNITDISTSLYSGGVSMSVEAKEQYEWNE